MNIRKTVVENDKLIMDLATYAATEGNMRPAPNTQEEAIKEMKRVQDRFIEYKRLLKSGEFTYNRLEKDVLDQYGITKPLVKQPKGAPDEVEQLLKQLGLPAPKKSSGSKDKPIIGFGER